MDPSKRVSSLSVVEPRFHVLRKRLDQMGYIQTLGIESFPLVEKLFNDCSLAIENLRRVQDASTETQRRVDVLSNSVEPYKSENGRLLDENTKLRHQLLTAKENAEASNREHRSVQRKGEQKIVDLQFLIAQYSKKVQSLEEEGAEKSKKILQLQEKNLQAVILTPGGRKQFIPFRRQRLEIANPPASLSSPSHLPQVLNQSKDVYVADMVKMSDSSLAAERNRCNQLQGQLQHCREEQQSFKDKIQVRELEIQRLLKLLESGRTPEAVTHKDEIAEKEQQIQQLKLQLDALQRQNEELRVYRPDKEPSIYRRLPKSSFADIGSSRGTERKTSSKGKRIEEELWEQLKDTKRKLSTLQTEHETCQQKLRDLRTKLTNKDNQHAKLEVLVQQINKDKEELGIKLLHLNANEKTLVQELSRVNSELLSTKDDAEVGERSQGQAEAQLEALTEYAQQLEKQRDQYKEEIRALLRLMPHAQSAASGSNRPQSSESGESNMYASHVGSDPRSLEARLKLLENERNFFRKQYQDLLADNLVAESQRRRAPSGCVTTTDKGVLAVDEELEELRRRLQEVEGIVEILQQRLDQAQENIVNLVNEKEALLAELDSCRPQEIRSEHSTPASVSSSRGQEPDGGHEIQTDATGISGSHETDARRASDARETISFQTQIIQMQYDVQRAREETQAVRSQLENSELEVLRMRDSVKEKENQLQATNQSHHDSEQIIASLQSAIEAQEREISALRDLCERVQSERDAALTASHSAHQGEHLHHQQRQEAFGIQASLTKLDSSNHEFLRELRIRESELSSCREQLRTEKERSARLEEERENIRKEHRRVLDDLSQITGQSQKLSRNLEDVQNEKSTLERQIQEYVTEVTRIRELLEIKERERLDLLEQYAHLSSEHMELERQHSSLENRSGSVTNMLMGKDMELMALQDTISSLENEVQRHLESQEAYNNQVFHLNGSVGELGSELEQKTAEVCTLHSQLEDITRRVKDLEAENSKLRRQVNVSQGDKDQLSARQEELQQEMLELREQLCILRGHIEQLEKLLISCRESEYRFQSSSHQASVQADSLDRELQEARDALDIQRRASVDLKSKLSELELELDKMKRDLTNEKFEKERAHQELRRYRQQHSCYVERHGSSPSEESGVTTPVSMISRTNNGGRGRLAPNFDHRDTTTRSKHVAFTDEDS